MIMFLLGAIDILAGLSLVLPSFLGFYLGIIVLLKGISSMLGIASGNVMIIIMGLIDIATGILLLTSFYIPWFWLIPVAKGLISMITSAAS
ncbi:MAG: hypothetical protein V1678_02025 [Candidatus Aenigmatarchaeota archaeon]